MKTSRRCSKNKKRFRAKHGMTKGASKKRLLRRKLFAITNGE